MLRFDGQIIHCIRHSHIVTSDFLHIDRDNSVVRYSILFLIASLECFMQRIFFLCASLKASVARTLNEARSFEFGLKGLRSDLS